MWLSLFNLPSRKELDYVKSMKEAIRAEIKEVDTALNQLKAIQESVDSRRLKKIIGEAIDFLLDERGDLTASLQLSKV